QRSVHSNVTGGSRVPPPVIPADHRTWPTAGVALPEVAPGLHYRSRRAEPGKTQPAEGLRARRARRRKVANGSFTWIFGCHLLIVVIGCGRVAGCPVPGR